MLCSSLWKEYTRPSSTEGGFWIVSLCSALLRLATKAALTPVSGPQRRRQNIGDKPTCHTLPDYLSPACCVRESKSICAVTQVYI